MIGLERGTVKLYKKNDLEWVHSFKVEKNKLSKVLGADVVDIQHVGSTAIPDIYAKPIIDIGVMVKSLIRVKKYIDALKKTGYVLKQEGRKDRLFFTKGPESKRTHYLHIGEKGTGYIEDMVLFRDYLIKHKSIAKEYESLKKKLATLHSGNRDIYTSKKEKFISSIVKKAKIMKIGN